MKSALRSIEETNARNTDSGWRSFSFSFIFIILLPLFPLLLEYLSTGTYFVSVKSIALAVAILVIGIGSTSNDLFQLIIGLFFGIIDSSIYTHISNSDIIGICIITITCIIMIWHLLERYDRHLIKGQRFFEFGKL